jgi:hypothetical protein
MKVTELTKAQKKVINQLRDIGFAVILWTPEELQGTSPITMEDESTEFGWGVIEDHGGRWAGLEVQVKCQTSDDGKKLTVTIMDHNGDPVQPWGTVKNPITYDVPAFMTGEEYAEQKSSEIETLCQRLGCKAIVAERTTLSIR